jgi:iron uptake system EfeUOB component EfeO/EfeM
MIEEEDMGEGVEVLVEEGIWNSGGRNMEWWRKEYGMVVEGFNRRYEDMESEEERILEDRRLDKRDGGIQSTPRNNVKQGREEGKSRWNRKRRSDKSTEREKNVGRHGN